MRILTPRTLILRLHFYLEMWAEAISARAPRGACPPGPAPSLNHLKYNSRGWDLHTGSSGTAVCTHGLDNKWIFFEIRMNIFPSTPVVLCLFFLRFHFLRRSPREISPRWIQDVVALMTIKHCLLEDSLPSGKRRSTLQQKQYPLLALWFLLFIAFFWGGGNH